MDPRLWGLVMNLIANLIDRLINRIYPLDLVKPFNYADYLADVEADHDAWEPAPAEPPLAEWERELIESVERSHKEKAVGAIAAAILRGHDVIGAPIYADLIAQALCDNFHIEPRTKGGTNDE